MDVESTKKIMAGAELALRASYKAASVEWKHAQAIQSIAGSLLALSKLLLIAMEEDEDGKEKEG